MRAERRWLAGGLTILATIAVLSLAHVPSLIGQDPPAPPPPTPTPVPVAPVVSGTISIPERVNEHQNVVLEVDTTAQFVEVEAVCRRVVSGTIAETYADILTLKDTQECAHRYAFTGAPGPWSVTVRLFDPQAGIKTERAMVTIGQLPKPPPVDPVDPVDPDPTDPDNPPPIPAAGLHVLIVEETADRGKLPAEQAAIFTSQVLADELRKLCPDRWRILDDDTPTSNLPDVWKSALALQRDRLPWLVVSNGNTGYSGPLPGSVDEVLQIVRSHAK